MKMQLKTLGVGLLLILGVNAVFAIPFGIHSVLYPFITADPRTIDQVINLISMVGRLVGLTFAGMLLSNWRNRWEAFPPSEHHSSVSDFFQRYTLLIVALCGFGCIFWQQWYSVIGKFVFELEMLISPMGAENIMFPFNEPFLWYLENLFQAPLLQFGLIGFLAGYFGRKSKLRPKTPKRVVTQSVS